VVLTGLRGGLAFLTRLPVGGGERAWDAFRRTPVAFPLVGYVIGGVAALPFLVPLPPQVTAVGYVATLYLVTGVTHVDGLADVADAAAVHAEGVDADRRREVLADPAVGVGGVLLVVLTVVGLAFAAFAVGSGTLGGAVAVGLPLEVYAARALTVVAVVVAAEVGAKTGMAWLVCTGAPAHEGLGSAVVGEVGPDGLLPVAVAVLPVVAFAPALSGPAVGAALVSPIATAALVGRWADGTFGGVSGDVLGAANELGRVVGLTLGVVAWTFA
jgi:adenosylcobinamide-GDP ribazoletransferase